MSESPATEIVYVSWGGTGRAGTLRRAMAEAHDTDRGLVYLAILDNSTFGDIDSPMLRLAEEELAWLLDAQLELTKSQTGVQEVDVRVLVRSGDVADEIVDAVAAVGRTEVLIGAPVPAAGTNAVTELVAVLNGRIDAPVTVIEP